MSPSDVQALQVFVAGIAGGLFQKFARAPQGVPMWVFYAGVGAAAAALYFWATPDVVTQFQGNWRAALMGMASWALMVRGGAASAKDMKLAGAANSQ